MSTKFGSIRQAAAVAVTHTHRFVGQARQSVLARLGTVRQYLFQTALCTLPGVVLIRRLATAPLALFGLGVVVGLAASFAARPVMEMLGAFSGSYGGVLSVPAFLRGGS